MDTATPARPPGVVVTGPGAEAGVWRSRVGGDGAPGLGTCDVSQTRL